jgi:hexokinase
MEWGNFFSSHLPITEYDQELDKESLNPGEQASLCIEDTCCCSYCWFLMLLSRYRLLSDLREVNVRNVFR